MQTKNVIITLAIGTVMLTSCSSMRGSQSSMSDNSTAFSQQGQMKQQRVSPEVLNQFTSGWPDSSQRAASDIIQKYGPPSESTSGMLIWRNIAPYKRITVFREEVNHKFPILHKDVVEHVIDYKVPVDKAADLTRFNGSLIFDRTRGELAVRGDQEPMNLLTLNLAADILSGKKSVEQARSELGRYSVDFLNGNRTTYTESLQFGGQYNTADADQSIKINWVQAQEAQPGASQNMNKQEGQDGRILKQAQEEEIAE